MSALIFRFIQGKQIGLRFSLSETSSGVLLAPVIMCNHQQWQGLAFCVTPLHSLLCHGGLMPMRWVAWLRIQMPTGLTYGQCFCDIINMHGALYYTGHLFTSGKWQGFLLFRATYLSCSVTVADSRGHGQTAKGQADSMSSGWMPLGPRNSFRADMFMQFNFIDIKQCI